MTPTIETYTVLQQIFDHFNDALFGSQLPQCLLTLRSSYRAYGYMHRRRFVNIEGKHIDEQGINPGYFALQSVEEVMATIVHEMVHHWQNHFGSPSKSMPHNREWADKMKSVGLMPTDTGLPGGKQTGRSMSDYILKEGPFVSACRSFAQKGVQLPWFDRHLPAKPERMAQRREELVQSGVAFVGNEVPLTKAVSEGITLEVAPPAVSVAPQRVRQVCPQCQIRAWTAPGVAIACGSCDVAMEES